jgi:hypothetical protein
MKGASAVHVESKSTVCRGLCAQVIITPAGEDSVLEKLRRIAGWALLVVGVGLGAWRTTLAIGAAATGSIGTSAIHQVRSSMHLISGLKQLLQSSALRGRDSGSGLLVAQERIPVRIQQGTHRLGSESVSITRTD